MSEITLALEDVSKGDDQAVSKLRRLAASASARLMRKPRTTVCLRMRRRSIKRHLLWLGIGTAESDFMRATVLDYHDAPDKAGIKTVFYESPGTAREWLT